MDLKKSLEVFDMGSGTNFEGIDEISEHIKPDPENYSRTDPRIVAGKIYISEEMRRLREQYYSHSWR